MWDSTQQTALEQALDRLWVRFLPQIEERVTILESAAFAAGQLSANLLSPSRLSIDQRKAASAAAHQLAGTLGTFGLTQGTVLARELEAVYSRECGPDPALAPRLTEIAAELRALIESRGDQLGSDPAPTPTEGTGGRSDP
jgi:HPt (histidine-containing phosphotransfer) domain-containing protein